MVCMQKGSIEAFGSYDQLSARGVCERLLSQESTQEEDTGKDHKTVRYRK